MLRRFCGGTNKIGAMAMTEERITERTDGVSSERVVERSPSAAPASTTYVEKRGGATGWIVALAAIVLVAIAAFYFMNAGRQQEARTDAVAGAAESVADSAAGAAESVGNAAENVADRVAPPAN